MAPDVWAERYRILSDRVSSEPGPLNLDRTPYARGILQALGGRYTEIVVQASAQSAKSEIGRSWLGWAADLDPGPCMVVFPTQESAEATIEERVLPMFRDTPRLRRLLSARAWDTTKSRIALSTCTINIGWAGSPQALASRPERRVLLDEVNKYPPYKGREADPITNARKRTESYGHRAQVYVVSTPTTPTGAVTVAYEACVDRRTYHVPCPRCDAWAPFDWEQVDWEGKDTTDENDLREQRARFECGALQAVYVCGSCEARLQDTERWGMVQRGEWVSEGFPRGQHPEAQSVGFQIHGLSTPWTSFSAMALKYVTAKLKGLAELQGFYNSDLGLPFMGGSDSSTQLHEVSQATLQVKAARGRSFSGPLPAWGTHVLASADPGRTGAHFTVRLWGRGYRSMLIDHGTTADLGELTGRVLDRQWALEDGRHLGVLRLLIDTGGGRGTSSKARTDEIYRYAKTAPGVIWPLKGYGGAGNPSQPVLTRSHTYHPPGQNAKPYDVTLSVIDTEYFKDLTAARIMDLDESLWGIACHVSVDYVLQVAAERKILVERRVKPSGEVTDVFRWVPRVVGSPNHYWDCEVYQSVAAYILDMDRVRVPVPPRPAPKQTKEPPRGNSQNRRGWVIGRG